MWTSLRRIIKSGWLDFSRNIGLSAAAIFIMAMVVLLVSILFLLNPVAKIIISDIQDKIDISVYFKKDTASEDIFQLQGEIAKIPDVKKVEYISRDQALANFTATHKDEQSLLDALKELGDNPFLPSLNVKAKEASQYEAVAQFLDNGQHQDIIEKVDYYQRKPIIDSVFSAVSWANKAGLFASIILAIIAFLVAYNTTKLAIYNASDEIKTMRLVGATSKFVRGPFFIQGVIVGFFAMVIALVITCGLAYGLNAKIQSMIPGVSLFNIFISNLGLLVLVQLATGIGLGIISSAIAIRKFLNV